MLKMFLDLSPLGTALEAAALMVAYRLPKPNPKNLEIVHIRIWVKQVKWTVSQKTICNRGTHSVNISKNDHG